MLLWVARCIEEVVYVKKYLKLAASVLLYTLIYIIPNGAAGVLLVVTVALSNIERMQDPLYIQQMVNKHIFTASLFALAVSASVLLIIFNYKKKNIIEHCSFLSVNFRIVLLSILLGAMSNVFVNTILTYMKTNTALMELLSIEEKILDTTEGVRVMVSGNIFMVILVIGILTPVFEEILYRGVIFTRLIEDISIRGAIIAQAIIFGLSHFNVIQGLYTFAFGLILVLCYHWLKSMWVPIIIHSSFNLTNIIVKLTLPPIPSELTVVLPLIMITLAFVTITLYYMNKGKMEPNTA